MAAPEDAEYPAVAEPNGIKLRPEKMVIDKLYHCVFDEKVFLFYKDEDTQLHCYEVEDVRAVQEIIHNPSDIEKILKKYSEG